MKAIVARHRQVLCHRPSLISLITAVLFFVGSLVVNFFANRYAFVSKGNSLTDILLDNLPVVHMENAFIIGTWVFVIIIFVLLVAYPHKVMFVLKAMALFIVTRAFFVTLTHIGPSPLNTLEAPGEIARAFSSGADLFFSGHTGMPFLFALMYWYNRNLRWLFLTISIVAGACVLLGHIHYSIDVASAFFITYGIYIISTRIFEKDWVEFKK